MGLLAASLAYAVHLLEAKYNVTQQLQKWAEPLFAQDAEYSFDPLKTVALVAAIMVGVTLLKWLCKAVRNESKGAGETQTG